MTRILIVDDSASMRAMVSTTLKGKGYDVKTAEDGQQAFSIAKSESFSAVITDVNMPNMDGISLVKNLRTLNNFKYTPILLLTTESSPEKKSQGKQAGATGWLVKPFDPNKLLSTLGKVMN